MNVEPRGHNKSVLRTAISAKAVLMAAAIAGVSGFAEAISTPRLPVRFSGSKGASPVSNSRPGRSGDKLRKLADKSGIGIRKHW